MASSDRDALLALHRSTGGPNWANKANWDTDTVLSEWHGVEVNSQGRVVKLHVGNNNLRGSIPRELGNVAALKVLNLEGNRLSGPIPAELGYLTALEKLVLWGNQLSGSIPPELGNLTALNYLYLHQNQLTGPIPAALGNLVALEKLVLWGNQLSRPIPTELGNLAALEKLSLWGNQLNGHIPKELGALSELEVLSLSNNLLTGEIPSELGNLATLETLNLYGNQLKGSIPKELGALSALRQLDLGYNHLTGFIPAELGNLTTLQLLNLEANSMSGNISQQLEHLSALTFLHLSFNNFDGPIPKELGSLSKLEKLLLYQNKLTGPIPPELGNLTALRKLSLNLNQLSGPVPATLGGLNELKVLCLEDNQLTEIPPELLKLCRRKLAEPSWGSNPWSRPPSTVLESGLENALDWWEDVERFGEGKSNRLKMVLVGLAEAGKTTVVRHFTGGPVPRRPDRTVGIEITKDWRPSLEVPLQVSIWDFAGQADYYSSHQLFLTKGALCLLVVDLHAFSKEVGSDEDNFTDPHGRIYWWLEMIHIRVPGAAIALVGTHVDDMEKDGVDSERAGIRLYTGDSLRPLVQNAPITSLRPDEAVSKFIESKVMNASNGNSDRSIDTESTSKTDQLRDRVQAFPPGVGLARRSGSSGLSTRPLVLHEHVFKVSLDPASVLELQDWIVKAAFGRGFFPRQCNFPAVDQIVPKKWIEAYDAMDDLKRTTPCVPWSKAVETFSNVISGSRTDARDAADPGEVLLRAMQHREAEGGALLSLVDTSAPVATDMLHLDPSWLIELVRRLADHNLVDDDEKKQGTIKQQLRTYARLHRLDLESLWDMHRIYCKSGHLDKDYLRFLWTYRKMDPAGSAVNLTDLEFESIVSTMARLLVMYRARGRGDFVVPARLPEYGDQRVLDPGNIAEIVVVVKCSFGQVYPPPGVVGRFLAWLTQVDGYGECWQHGAFVNYSDHNIFLYESEEDEPHEDGTKSKFAGLTLGVQGRRPEARAILKRLKASLKQLVSDSALGYPGLASLMSFDEPVETKSNELLALRSVVDIIDDRLEKIERKLDGVAKQLVEQVMWATSGKREDFPYPRLVILVPDEKGCGAQGRIQRTVWDRWREAWKRLDNSVGLHQDFRLRFLCEYDLTEVPCGPDGRGYLIKKPKDWVKECIPLMQASLWILRVAVGAVSNVDLPMNEVLSAVVAATGAELMEGIGTDVPSTLSADQVSVIAEGEPAERSQQWKDLQGSAYDSLCKFMRRIESPPPLRWLRCPPCQRLSSPLADSWKTSMVQEKNRNGGWAWILKTNHDAYVRENREAASAVSAQAPIS